jgi:hypothetical protein
VFVTAPGDDVIGPDAVPSLGVFSFGETLPVGPVVVGEGTYRIRVTLPAPAVPADIVYDSGPVDLAGGSDLLVAAVPTTRPGEAPISLLVSTGAAVLELLDANTPTNLRVVHASPNAPNVDVVINDDFAAAPRPISDLAYQAFTPYVPVTLDDNYKVVPTGADTPVVIDATPPLVFGADHTLFAAGILPAAPPVELTPLLLGDDNRSVATEAKVRLVHASPAAGEVDIYVVPAGTPIDDTVEPAFAAVPFLADTGYVSLAPGNYDVVVDPADPAVPSLELFGLVFAAGGVYTAAAVDQPSGGTPLQVITLDDFNP